MPPPTTAQPWDRLFWTLFALLAAVVLATFRDYAVSWDEPLHHTYGELALRYFLSGGADTSYLAFQNLYLYGALFDTLATALGPLLPFVDPYDSRHLLNAAVGLLGIAGTWRLARLVGGPRAGLLAAVLLALLPGYYGHMFNNPKDIPFAAGIIWSLYFLATAIRDLPRPPWRELLAFGVCAGLTLGVRVGAAALLGLFTFTLFGLWLALLWRRHGSPVPALRQMAGVLPRLLVATLVAYVVMVIGWPWAHDAPLARPLQALLTFSNFPLDIPVMIDGEDYSSLDLPRWYLPLFIAIKLPLLHLGLVLAAVAVPLLHRNWQILPAAGDKGPWLATATAWIALLVPVVYAIIARPVLYDEMRHFLFVLPPLAVIAGVMLDRLLAAPCLRPPLRAGILALLGGYATFHLALLAHLHPVEYTYYNALVGGVRGAAGRFDLDYWGGSMREAATRLEEQLVARHGPAILERPLVIAVCGPLEPARQYVSSAWSVVDDRFEPERANLVLGITRYPCAHQPQQADIRVERLGLLFAYATILAVPDAPPPPPAEPAP